MRASKTPNPRWVAIILAVIALGLFGMFRPLNESARVSMPSAADASIPSRQDDRGAGGADRGKSRNGPVFVKRSKSFTVDELVAIYESEGAAAAIAAAKGMTEPERASQVVFILTYLARIDPELVAGELKEAGLDTTHQGFIVDAVMRDWKDGKKALEWAKSHFTGDLLKRAVGGALRILVRTDPRAALAYLDTLPTSGNRSQAIADIFVPWGECDPKAALKLLAENFPADERESAMEWVITGWSRGRPAEAAAWIGSVQDEALRASLEGNVAMNWKMKSPEEATAWVESLPEGPGKEAAKVAIQQAVTVIECGFESSQPLDVSWKTKTVATMEDKDLRNWGYQDTEGARKFLETAPEGRDLNELVIIVAVKMKEKEGFEATFDWARTLHRTAADQALRCAVILWSDSDPAAAAKRVETLAPEQREPLASALAENWCRNDPAAAAAWVAAYPRTGQKALVREVLQQWTDSQPREAYAWLGTLPMGASRDEGIRYLMRRESSSDPKSVLPWIDLLSDPRLREEMRQELDQDLKRAGK